MILLKYIYIQCLIIHRSIPLFFRFKTNVLFFTTKKKNHLKLQMALTVKEEEFSNTLIKNASAFDRLKLGNLKNLKIQKKLQFYI